MINHTEADTSFMPSDAFKFTLINETAKAEVSINASV